MKHISQKKIQKRAILVRTSPKDMDVFLSPFSTFNYEK